MFVCKISLQVMDK